MHGYQLVKASTFHKFALGEFLWVTVTWAGEELHSDSLQSKERPARACSKQNPGGTCISHSGNLEAA